MSNMKDEYLRQIEEEDMKLRSAGLTREGIERIREAMKNYVKSATCKCENCACGKGEDV